MGEHRSYGALNMWDGGVRATSMHDGWYHPVDSNTVLANHHHRSIEPGHIGARRVFCSEFVDFSLVENGIDRIRPLLKPPQRCRVLVASDPFVACGHQTPVIPDAATVQIRKNDRIGRK